MAPALGERFDHVCRVCGFEVRTAARRYAWVRLEARGECDFNSADLLCAAVAHHVRAGRRLVHLDLSGVTFLDAAGLRALVEARNRLLERHGRLTLMNPAPCVARLLRLTELDTVMTIRTTGSVASAVDDRQRLRPASPPAAGDTDGSA